MTSLALTGRYGRLATGVGGPDTGKRRKKPTPTLEPVSLLADTDWTLIDRAAVEGDADSGVTAMEQIARRYWPVIYGYTRASGCDVHGASDITQGFLCDVVLSGKLLEKADRARGRFRALLRVAVRNYLLDQRRKQAGRGKDTPRTAPVGSKMSGFVEVAPEQAFDEQWAAALIRRVLAEVRRHYMQQCQEAHWEVFVGRVVRPMLFGEAPVPYEALIERFDLTDASQASNMMITVKRKFARTMRAEVAHTVISPEDVDQELRELLGVFERGI